MFELFMYVYSCNALSARFFTVDRALNSYFMIIMIMVFVILLQCKLIITAQRSQYAKYMRMITRSLVRLRTSPSE